MQVSIEVADEQEGNLIRSGLEDQAVRAFVKITAALAPLPDNESRERAVRAACIIMQEEYPEPRRRVRQ